MAKVFGPTPCPGAVDGRSEGKSGDHHLRVKGVVPMAKVSDPTPCPGAADGRSKGKSGDHHLWVKGVVPMAKVPIPKTLSRRRKRASDYFWERSIDEELRTPPRRGDDKESRLRPPENDRVARASADFEEFRHEKTTPKPGGSNSSNQDAARWDDSAGAKCPADPGGQRRRPRNHR